MDTHWVNITLGGGTLTMLCIINFIHYKTYLQVQGSLVKNTSTLLSEFSDLGSKMETLK